MSQLFVNAKPWNTIIIGTDEPFIIDLYIQGSGASYRVIDNLGNVLIAPTPITYTEKQWFRLFVDFSVITTVGFYYFQIIDSAGNVFYSVEILRCRQPTGAYRYEIRKPNDVVALTGNVIWLWKNKVRVAENVALDIYQLSMPSGVDISVIAYAVSDSKVYAVSLTISQITGNQIVYVEPQDYLDLQITIGITDNLELLKTLGYFIDPVLKTFYDTFGLNNLLGVYVVQLLTSKTGKSIYAYEIYPDKLVLYYRFPPNELVGGLATIIAVLIILAVIVLGVTISWTVMNVVNSYAKIVHDQTVAKLSSDYQDVTNKILTSNLSSDQKAKLLEMVNAYYNDLNKQLTSPSPTTTIDWKTIALAGGIGVLAGYLISRGSTGVTVIKE